MAGINASDGVWHDTGKLWLCLYFPSLGIDYWQRASDQPQALALYEGQRLLSVSALASAAGVERGMSTASATTLLPRILLRPYVPEHEEGLLKALMQWAYQYTPYVSAAGGHYVALEISGSLRLFHGLSALLARVVSELAGWRCEVFTGLGTTAEAARLLALTQRVERQPSLAQQQNWLAQKQLTGFLNRLPVARLGLAQASLNRLARAGFRQLEQLLALPLGSVGQRFGKATVRYIQQLRGVIDEPLQAMAIAPEFDRSLGFMYGLTDRAHLQNPMQSLLLELNDFLRQRQLFARRLCWRFRHEDKGVTELIVAVQHAHADTDEFYRLTCLKLESVQLSSAIEIVGLKILELCKAEPVSNSLFRELRDDSDQADRLINRLYQRFSCRQFFCLQLKDEHLPERQQSPQPAKASVFTAAKGKQPNPFLTLVNSAKLNTCPWMFSQALPLRVRQQQVYWQREPLVLVSNALRIDSHWWQERERRDYYIALSNHHYYQIFFCLRSRQWFVSGCYVC